MLRRHLLGLAAASLAAPGLAFADDVQRIPLSRAFRYLDAYLGLAPSLRSRFYLAYRAMRDEHPAPDLKAAIIDPGGIRIPLALDARAEVMRLPSLPELKSSAVLEVAGGGKFRFATEIRPDVAPATRIDVPALVAALAQANAAVAHLAGAFSMMAPKLDMIVFADAGSGQALMPNGRSLALPATNAIRSLGSTPCYQPGALPGANVIALARVPSRILFAHDPKG